MSAEPYISSQDSALFREALSRYAGDACIEIGAGNGGGLSVLSKRFKTVVGTDIVRPSMDDWRAGASFLLADGASCIRSSSFNLVAFNPPYLEEEETGDAAVEGGHGLEVPKRFLREALRTVKKDGTVVFLLNDQADLAEMEAACAEGGFRLRRLSSLRLFYEELSVYEAAGTEPKATRPI
ncbi:MAG: hypothetical protein JRN21_07490 [Nitrososphaerota archaeon]|nr:hypothetical protein [Nitrososphaerota archaeon]